VPGDTAVQLPAQLSARADGERAADERGVEGSFTVSFFGGLSLGLFAPLGLRFDEPLLVVLGGAGAAAVGLTYDNAGNTVVTEDVEQRLQLESAAYQDEFRAAYHERLAKRRQQASIWGGGVGTGMGLGLLGWLLWEIAHSDF
jgi:hypothetical protein